MLVTAPLMIGGHIDTTGGLFYPVLACCKCVGHPEALLFFLCFGYVSSLTCPARCAVRWQWPSLVPPGMPGGQKEAENAPEVLDCIVVGVMPFDEGARG